MNPACGQRHEGAAGVVRWMLSEGRFNTHMREFGDEMCRRIVTAGIPIWRGFCYVGTLHPQIASGAYEWQRGDAGATRKLGAHGVEQREDFIGSPLNAARRMRSTIRRRLEQPQGPFDFAVLEDYKKAGATDYVAIPMPCSNDEVNGISFQTDAPGGFTDAHVAGLEEIAQALGIIVELQSSRRIAKSMLDTYVGRRTAARVLRGAIKRGSGEAIRAVIWMCDLRGFTELSENLGREELVALLNDYFAIMADAVLAEGGEVLKFIGDGMLAIFELGENADAAACCAAALRAARNAIREIGECNARRLAAGAREIRFGLALHLGQVYYGNIGAQNRLDFTVIGPAVNHASRLEKRGSELGRLLVTSASFAAASPEALESLGLHQLRGVAETQEIFAPGLRANSPA
jgi:adenylate cyclase